MQLHTRPVHQRHRSDYSHSFVYCGTFTSGNASPRSRTSLKRRSQPRKATLNKICGWRVNYGSVSAIIDSGPRKVHFLYVGSVSSVFRSVLFRRSTEPGVGQVLFLCILVHVPTESCLQYICFVLHGSQHQCHGLDARTRECPALRCRYSKHLEAIDVWYIFLQPRVECSNRDNNRRGKNTKP